MKNILFALLILLFSLGAFAQENTTNETLVNASNEATNEPSENQTSQNMTSGNMTALAFEAPADSPAQEAGTQSQENVTLESNQTPTEPQIDQTPEVPKIMNFTVHTVIPREFKVGEIQFNLPVENTGNVEIADLAPIITGKGFALLDMVPIEVLRPAEKSYVLVMGEVKQAGTIFLTIRMHNKIFTKNITVVDPEAAGAAEKLQQMEAQEKAKEAVLQIFSSQLTELKQKHDEMESNYRTKLKENYDVSDVELDALKEMLRDAESGLIAKDVIAVNASLTIARQEFEDQKQKLDTAIPIKKTIIEKIQDNFLLLSTLAGAIITFITLWEILKKQKDTIYEKIKEVQVSEDTKIEVKRKRKNKQK